MKEIYISDFFKCESIEVKKYDVIISEKIKNLKITIDSDKFEHFFLIVKDPKGDIRAALTYKTRIKEYIISEDEDYSSYCTKSGKIEIGKWEFTIIKPYEILGGFSILIQSVDFSVKNELEKIQFEPMKIFNKIKGWYKGDLHIHSTYTDGRQTLEDINRKSLEKRLNFMALTDHSIVSTHFYKDDERVIIPATEITFDDDGHFNIFGITEFIDYTMFFENAPYSSKDDIVNKVIKYYKNKNKIISINHPFHEEIPFKHNIDFENIDFIEVLNSPHEPKKEDHNLKAIKFLDFLWEKNFLIYGLGGSDSHKDLLPNRYSLGDPLNYVYMENLSYDELFKAFKKGNSYVARDGEVDLKILCNEVEVLPGEKVKGDISYSVSYKKELIWTLIKNGKEIEKQKGNKANFLCKIEENDFCRVEGYNEELKRMEIYINPIHYKENQRISVKWGTLIEEYLEVNK